MNNLGLFGSLFFLLFFNSCNNISTKYQLKEIDSYASCATFQIIDSNNQPVDLPKHIVTALDCPDVLDLTDGILTYLDGLTIKLYKIEEGKDYPLFSLFEGMDGISNPVWSDDKSRIMFVIIDQEKRNGYKETTRIISLDLNEKFEIRSKLKFDRKVNFVCGSICTSHAYEDFIYEKNKIKFKRNINIEDRPGGFEFILLENH